MVRVLACSFRGAVAIIVSVGFVGAMTVVAPINDYANTVAFPDPGGYPKKKVKQW